MDEIDRRFNEDKPALATYNLKDCELVTQIFHKTEIMPFLLERATVNGLAVDRHGGSVAAFSHLYFPRMHRAGYVAPTSGTCRRRQAPAAMSWIPDQDCMTRCWCWTTKACTRRLSAPS
jgi:DNA polymerase-2